MDIRFFEEFPEVEAGFTTAPDTADERRLVMAREAESSGGCVVRPRLVHGFDVYAVVGENLIGPYIEFEDTDGLVTELKDVTLTSTHADCVPVYIYDPVRRAIGLAHAGWRGTVACIASELVYAMEEMYGCRPEDMRAVIGPAIGLCCFEVGSDVADRFLEELPLSEEYMVEKGGGKFAIDLKGINAELLRLEGLEEISISPDCTCCGGERFYSYRRDGEKRRMLAYIKLRT